MLPPPPLLDKHLTNTSQDLSTPQAAPLPLLSYVLDHVVIDIALPIILHPVEIRFSLNRLP